MSDKDQNKTVNTDQYLSESQLKRKKLHEKWAPFIDAEVDGAKPITDTNIRMATAIMLENMCEYSKKNPGECGTFPDSTLGALNETQINAMGASSSSAGPFKIYDPVLVSMVRRAAPKLIAFDIAGVQPMTQPTGVVFYLKSHYKNYNNAEALFNEANTSFSAENAGNTFNFDSYQSNSTVDIDINATNYVTTGGMTTAQLESLGSNTGTGDFNQMSFEIKSYPVNAKGRGIKSGITMEALQDLRSVHNIDGEAEMARILEMELVADQNREMIRRMYQTATIGAQNTTSAGYFNMNIDADGRWQEEKFKGLRFQIERESNKILHTTRRGAGNFIVCTPNIASAFSSMGMLTIPEGLQTYNTDSTFAGILNGKYRVYVDPYVNNSVTTDVVLIGYRGNSPLEAGIFFCPYVPAYYMRSVGEEDFQPRLAIKTRYAIQSHPYATAAEDGTIDAAKKNSFFRMFIVQNL